MVFLLHFFSTLIQKSRWRYFMRSDVREGVQIYIMSDIKPNFTHLAKQFDCDPRTVKRY